MSTTVSKLLKIHDKLSPKDGFSGYFDFMDTLDSKPKYKKQFTDLFQNSSIEELDSLINDEFDEAWIIMGAADAYSIIPNDHRLFKSREYLESLPTENLLGEMCSACILNDVNAVDFISSKTDVNQLDHNKQTALGYAVGNNHIECVRVLLEKGANPNTIENGGRTAMHYCATTVASKDIYKLLLSKGGNPNQHNDDGQSAIDLMPDDRREEWLC